MVTALVVFCLLIGAAILFCVSVYNTVVRKNARCDETWDAFERELSKRSELVVALFDVASAHPYDDAYTQAVTDAYYALDEAAGVAATLEASDRLGHAIKDLIEQMQGNDELRANASFQALTVRMSAVEKELAAAKQAFVSSVDDYNKILTTRHGSTLTGPRFRIREGGSAKAQS